MGGAGTTPPTDPASTPATTAGPSALEPIAPPAPALTDAGLDPVRAAPEPCAAAAAVAPPTEPGAAVPAPVVAPHPAPPAAGATADPAFRAAGAAVDAARPAPDVAPGPARPAPDDASGPTRPAPYDAPGLPAAGLDVAPFVATGWAAPIRADPARLADLTAPAYDLISPAERTRLASADPHAVVHLTLPTLGADDAARRLALWRTDGTLTVDTHPALYVYDLAEPGRVSTRGWLAAAALTAPGAGPIAPHEATAPAAVVDRQRLRAATRADLEPILLAHDGPPAAADALAHRYVAEAEPVIDLLDDAGVRHRLWRVVAPEHLAAVVADLAQRRAVIADGHHRYAAALAQRAADPGNGPAGRLLALLVPIEPHGPRVQAIHRVLPDVTLDALAARAAGRFRIDEVPAPADPGSLLGSAAGSLLLASDGQRWLRLTEPDRAALVPAPPWWRALDVALADVGLGSGDADTLLRHTVAAALDEVALTTGVALLLRPTPTATVLDLAAHGVLMPRKSTLFVPKPRTGLVLRCFADQPDD